MRQDVCDPIPWPCHNAIRFPHTGPDAGIQSPTETGLTRGHSLRKDTLRATGSHDPQIHARAHGRSLTDTHSIAIALEKAPQPPSLTETPAEPTTASAHPETHLVRYNWRHPQTHTNPHGSAHPWPHTDSDPETWPHKQRDFHGHPWLRSKTIRSHTNPQKSSDRHTHSHAPALLTDTQESTHTGTRRLG